MAYLTDESGNRLTDESGNLLTDEEVVSVDLALLIDADTIYTVTVTGEAIGAPTFRYVAFRI
jgi:hypothetical protein